MWSRIANIWHDRKRTHSMPLQLKWQKAHVCDHVPLSNILMEHTQPFGLTPQAVRCNRIADEAARTCALRSAAIHPQLFPYVQQEAYKRQVALAELNQVIGFAAPQRVIASTKEEQLDVHDDNAFQLRFPQWDWHPQLHLFSWAPTALNRDIEESLRVSGEDREAVLDFLMSLKWHVHPAQSVAYVELTFLFCARKFSLSSVSSPTFGCLEGGQASLLQSLPIW